MEFIAKGSPAYAAAFAQQVCDVGDSLADYAERGQRLPYRELGRYRRILVGTHLLIYTIEAASVTLHAVMHGSRDFPKVLMQRLRPR